jgi:Family of unknown function (DUF6516)
MRAAAQLLLRERLIVGDNQFADIVIWRVPNPVAGSAHGFKYRLAFVVDDACVMRFDDETGKGDHKPVGPRQRPYVFMSVQQLIDDFWNEVDEWSRR